MNNLHTVDLVCFMGLDLSRPHAFMRVLQQLLSCSIAAMHGEHQIACSSMCLQHNVATDFTSH